MWGQPFGAAAALLGGVPDAKPRPRSRRMTIPRAATAGGGIANPQTTSGLLHIRRPASTIWAALRRILKLRRRFMPQRRATRQSVANNYILIVFDSCRYDSFQRARPRTI